MNYIPCKHASYTCTLPFLCHVVGIVWGKDSRKARVARFLLANGLGGVGGKALIHTESTHSIFLAQCTMTFVIYRIKGFHEKQEVHDS